METLLMSGKERKRLVLMAEVKKGAMSVAEAGRVIGVSYRQAKRIWKRFRQSGDPGLVHRARGKPGPRRKKTEFRERVLARFEERYADFGPTFATEKLAEEGLTINHETLRRWLLEAGRWTVGRKRHKHRAWRERKECFGQMVQLDGSHHDWFEGRAPKAVLMVMIDDATNVTAARFAEEETTEASYDVFEAWVRKYGLPASLYVDRDSIYRCERLANVEEQIAGKEPQTQFGRAMEQLGVELILANSPQAKGRVERRNGLLQDRLVKELRLAGISDIQAANAFLTKTFLPQLNTKFRVEPRSAVDAHHRCELNLKEILCWEETRVVARDWTVAWNARWFQIEAEHERLSLAGKKITVRELRDGSLQLLSEGRKLRWKELPARPQHPKPEPRRVGRTTVVNPPKEHPWRQRGIAYSERFWRAARKRGADAKRANSQAAAASGQPPLRSGFPTAAAA
jgi:molybdenum-dependent DNA-binding transcriptional regulator ModE